MIDDVTLQKCQRRFAQEANIVAVWLLGSAVNGRLREESDIDLAVLYKLGLARDFEQLGQLTSDLELVLGRRVDLGVLDTRNLIYAHEAVSKGRRIYCDSTKSADLFVSRVHALYFDLKRDRKVVEDAYCA